MFYVRPITREDLSALLTLSERTGTGLTSLPANAERLEHRIARSLASFAGTASKADACYVFVLVDGESDAVVGISAIQGAVGRNEPWYNYHVGTQVHASRELDVYTAAPTLFLTNDHTGHSELSSLFVDVRYRRARNGPLIAKARFLFIAEFAERFAPKVIAEMRGRLDANGKSPFWEGLGRQFFAIEFSRADYLTGIGQKAFVAELMPRHPVYTTLLPAEARAVIGQVHADTEAARAMLESEGFRYDGYIDIFDAGPTLECFRDDIRAVRQSQTLPVAIGEENPVPDSLTDEVIWLVANRSFENFRAILAPAPPRIARFPLLPHAASALGVGAGDTVRAVPLSPRDRR
jgi:arginine N-succinyltransferase